MTSNGFTGEPVISDIDETGTSAVKNIVVLSQTAYGNLGTKNSDTLYFIT
jgi:hypothetical protein